MTCGATIYFFLASSCLKFYIGNIGFFDFVVLAKEDTWRDFPQLFPTFFHPKGQHSTYNLLRELMIPPFSLFGDLFAYTTKLELIVCQ